MNKIDPSKTYRTRDGREVVHVSVYPDNPFHMVVIAHVKSLDSNYVHSVELDKYGQVANHPNSSVSLVKYDACAEALAQLNKSTVSEVLGITVWKSDCNPDIPYRCKLKVKNIITDGTTPQEAIQEALEYLK